MPAEKVMVRELRANLKKYIEAGDSILVMNHRHVVGVLLPVTLERRQTKEVKRAALSRLRNMLEQEVREELLSL